MPGRVILQAKPSLVPTVLYWLVPSVVFLCLIIFSANIFATRIVIIQFLYSLIALLVIFAVAVRTLIDFIDRQATTYTLTESQLVVDRGFLFNEHRPIPRSQIFNAEVQSTFHRRAAGYGNVIVNTLSGQKS